MTDFKNGQELLEVCKNKAVFDLRSDETAGNRRRHPPQKKKWKIRCEKPSPS